MARGTGADHNAKRESITESALRVVRQQGIEALSFRNVAAEAGVSLGRIQHYFADRSDLVHATFHLVQAATKERIEREIAADPDPSGPAVIESVLRSLVPVTPSQLADMRVAHAFESYALRDPDLLTELRTGHAALADFLAGLIVHSSGAATTAPDVDPARTVLTLLATAEGLAGLVLIGHLPGPVALDLLNSALSEAL